MRPDIVNLRQFYSSRLGRRVKARLCKLVLSHWPVHKGEPIVGIGYATPLLHLLERAGPQQALVIPLMPAVQGAIYWPVHMENHSVLGDEMRPPFAQNSLTRVLMLHAFEHAAQPEELLRITWQVMAPGGRLILIVPNRRGLWARFGHTPFVTGTPYTLAGMRALLEKTEFTLCDVSAAMFAPPSSHPFWLHAGPVLEWLGGLFFPRAGGVYIIEVEKQIYAAVGERTRVVGVERKWQVQPNVAAYKH